MFRMNYGNLASGTWFDSGTERILPKSSVGFEVLAILCLDLWPPPLINESFIVENATKVLKDLDYWRNTYSIYSHIGPPRT